MVEIFFWEDLERNNTNPYESVIGAAREARRVNSERRARGVELTDKPTTIALRRLVTGQVSTVYLSSKEIAAMEEAHASDSRSDEKKDSSGSDRGDRGL